MSVTEQAWPEYRSVADLKREVARSLDRNTDRLDDEVSEAVDIKIEQADDRVKLICERPDDPPTLEPSSGTWGTDALERVHDIFVDTVQDAGRYMEDETPMNESKESGRLAAYVPVEPNPRE